MKKIKVVDSSWNFEKFDTKNSVHNLHYYPAMLTPSLVNRVFEELDDEVNVVFDPFVGSGTVLVEALKRDFSQVYGFDINPLALLIAKVKTTPVAEKTLIRARDDIQRRFLKYKKEKRFFRALLPKNLDITYWFKPSVTRDLTCLKRAIYLEKNTNVRDFFLVVLAETALRTSYKRTNEFKMYRLAKEDLKVFKPDVLAEFLEKSNDSIKKLYEFHSTQIAVKSPKLTIRAHDARHKSTIKDESVDLIITSPPYGDSRTTVAYGEFSKIGGMWLDLDNVWSLDRNCLGGLAENSRLLFQSPTLNSLLKKIENSDKSRAVKVRTFFNDFYLCADEIDRVLKKGKTACFVVGNRCVKGQIVETDTILVDIFRSKGYTHVKTIVREIPSKKMPRFISPSGIKGEIRNTMQNEYMVFLQKGV